VVPDQFGSQVGPLRSRILVMGRVAYFVTGAGTLWRTDGTAAGTSAIIGVSPMAYRSIKWR
jgi:ELWxxDGT repeat protein